VMTAHLYRRKLERVLDRMGGLYTVQDILSAIAVGKMQSFVEKNSWAITQIAEYPKARVLEIVAVVGDLDDLRELHDKILEYARDMNVGVINSYGRKGWLPDAKRRGWTVKSRSFVYQRNM
jgi:hypothetical protein